MKRYIKSAVNIPREGIFWYINDSLVAFTDQVDINDPLGNEPMLHKEVWPSIRDQYLVDDTIVAYDYYPRGRVTVYPFKSKNRTEFACSVFCDSCIIKNPSFREQLEEAFRLYLSNCKVDYVGQMSIDGTHYTCHICRK